MVVVLFIKTGSSFEVKGLPYRIAGVIIRYDFFLC